MSDSGSTRPPSDGPADLPLRLTVTEAVQELLMAAATRVLARALMPPLLVAAAVLAALFAADDAVPVAVLVVVLAAGFALFFSLRLRGLVRRSFPVGRILRAEVTAEHLAVSVTGGVILHAWSYYSKLRVTEDAVLLRVRRTRRTISATQVLPRALFRPADLSLLEASVPPWS